MANIFDGDAQSTLVARGRSLRPDSRRHCGRMSPHEAICHLSDAFRMAPQGLRTVPEAEQGLGGTCPIEFERDRAELLAWIARFSAARPDELQPAHPMLGTMRTNEWGRWGYRHVDHHLRQFGA